MIDGFLFLAILNNSLIIFSLSPTYLLIRSELLTLKNVALHSVAHAYARYVFPVPGGPYNRIPFHGFITPLKISGNFIGIVIVSFNIPFAFSRPIISFHYTSGLTLTIELIRLLISLSSSLLIGHIYLISVEFIRLILLVGLMTPISLGSTIFIFFMLFECYKLLLLLSTFFC